MPSVCVKCANEISGESVRCEGFCACDVCLRCSGLSTTTLASMQANAHCIWICTACKNLLAKARFSNALVSTDAANNAIVESLKTEIKDGILAEIRTEIKQSFEKLNADNNERQNGNGKRQRDNTESNNGNSPKRTAIYTRGVVASSADEAGMFASSSAADTSQPLFWLYMKGFRPDVAEEKVSQWVQQKLETSDIKVRKLVPKGRDVRELSFVSFRVGMPIELKNKALCKDTWPCEIQCREFENKSQVGFDPDAQQAEQTQLAPVISTPPKPTKPTPPTDLQQKTPTTVHQVEPVQNMSV